MKVASIAQCLSSVVVVRRRHSSSVSHSHVTIKSGFVGVALSFLSLLSLPFHAGRKKMEIYV